MSENQLVERVKLLLGPGPAGSPTAWHPLVSWTARPAPATLPDAPASPPPAPLTASSGDEPIVLTLAQRMAEEHIAAATRRAQQTRVEAEAAAGQIRRDAETYAAQVRAEADSALAAARTAAEIVHRDADAQNAETVRQAELKLAGARQEAGRLIADANETAEQLRRWARQRSEEEAGSWAVKRETLQDQIEALENFDTDYRTRLTAFLQSQLSSLWADQPPVLDLPAADRPTPDGFTRPATDGD
jgi:hypothetical protein